MTSYSENELIASYRRARTARSVIMFLALASLIVTALAIGIHYTRADEAPQPYAIIGLVAMPAHGERPPAIIPLLYNEGVGQPTKLFDSLAKCQQTLDKSPRAQKIFDNLTKTAKQSGAVFFDLHCARLPPLPGQVD